MQLKLYLKLNRLELLNL